MDSLLMKEMQWIGKNRIKFILATIPILMTVPAVIVSYIPTLETHIPDIIHNKPILGPIFISMTISAIWSLLVLPDHRAPSRLQTNTLAHRALTFWCVSIFFYCLHKLALFTISIYDVDSIFNAKILSSALKNLLLNIQTLSICYICAILITRRDIRAGYVPMLTVAALLCLAEIVSGKFTRLSPADVTIWFRAISSIAHGVSIAMLIGCLDRGDTAPGRLSVIAIYLYASTYPVIAVYDADLTFFTAASYVSSILSLVLFIYIYWIFKTSKIDRLMLTPTDRIAEYTSQADKTPGVSQTDDTSNESEPTSCRVFVAIPMASVNADAQTNLSSLAIDVMEEIKKQGHTAYCAAKEKPPWPPQRDALSEATSEIGKCDVFVVIWDIEAITSALVEVGIAYAKGKRIVIFKKEKKKLPFLLVGIGETENARILEYKNREALLGMIKSRLRSLVQGAT